MNGPRMSGRSAEGRLILVFVLLTAGIVTTGRIYYRNIEKHFRAEVEVQLSTIAELKVDELVQWRKERLLGDGAVFSKNPSFGALVRRFFEKPEDTEAPRQIQAWLEEYQTMKIYDQLRLLDAQGVTRMTIPAARTPMSSVISQRIPEVVRSGQVTFQDFYRKEQDQRVYLAVMVPLLDAQEASRPLGALVLRIDPETYLYPFIKRWPTPSLTAETLLVRRDGNEALFLNDLRFQSNAALALRQPLERTEVPAVRAVLGQTEIMPGVDYRGVPVIAATLAVPDSPWFIVAKIDTAEVYAPMRERLWQLLLLMGVLIFGAGISVFLVWREQRARSYLERAETAEALREKEARYRTLVENIPQKIFMKNRNYQYISISENFARDLGVRPEEVLGKEDCDLFSRELADKHRTDDKRIMDTGQTEEIEERYVRDGRETWVNTVKTPVRDHNGEIIGVLGIFSDITERRRKEAALRESEERFRSLATATSQIIWSTDGQGQVCGPMPSFQAYTGQNDEEIRGSGWASALHPDDVERTIEVWRNAVEAKVGYRTEYRLRRHDGIYRYFTACGAPVVTDDGRIREWIGTCSDITERKQAEEEIGKLSQELEARVEQRTVQLEAANKELETFSYSVSHDLRAPLRGIDGWSQALLEDFGDKLGEAGLQLLHRQRSASQRMGALIDDLLRLARLARQPLTLQTVAPAALVHRVWVELGSAQPPQTAELVVGVLPDCHADPSLITQVFVNLLGNALKFSSGQPHPRIEVGSQAGPDHECVYFVKDNGAGFDMRYADKLFGAFQRLHSTHEFPGTGIGLALTQRILHRHGGRIWAKSAVGQGATFYFTLPAEEMKNEK
jgi:PAS domain S-box-containing protein